MEIAFNLQETIITTLYVYLFLIYTKDRRHEPDTKKVLWQLFFAEFVVFSTDIIMNVLLYTVLSSTPNHPIFRLGFEVENRVRRSQLTHQLFACEIIEEDGTQLAGWHGECRKSTWADRNVSHTQKIRKNRFHDEGGRLGRRDAD